MLLSREGPCKINNEATNGSDDVMHEPTTFCRHKEMQATLSLDLLLAMGLLGVVTDGHNDRQSYNMHVRLDNRRHACWALTVWLRALVLFPHFVVGVCQLTICGALPNSYSRYGASDSSTLFKVVVSSIFLGCRFAKGGDGPARCFLIMKLFVHLRRCPFPIFTILNINYGRN